MKRILVIGSNSFSGSDFIDLLLENGSYDVVGMSRSPEKSSLFLPYKKRDLKHFRFVQLDLNKDIELLDRFLDEFQPDYVVNFAAQSEVAPSWKFPHHWFQTNAVAITQLAHVLKNKKFLKRYLHISSPEVYGTCEGIIKEDAPLNPSTPYAASKAAGDLSLFTFYKNFSFPLTMIRATNVYGAYQQLFKIIPRSILYIEQKKIIELHGGGNAVKSYIHIRDVSRGELSVLENGRTGQIYHLSPDQGVAVKDVVSMICKKLDVSFESATRTVEERLGQDKAYIIDSSLARQELGWHPEISLEQGVAKTIQWIQENYATLHTLPLDYAHVP